MVKTLVLTGYGINCEHETAFAFERAGSHVDILHLTDLSEQKSLLRRYQILALPGGFSFGDDLGSGKVLAAYLRHHFQAELMQFLEQGKLILGICNGFQVLANLGIFEDGWSKEVALTFNESARFEDRWVNLRVPASRCIWTRNIKKLYLPARHGEGRFIASKETLQRFQANHQIALQYHAGYPANPNGSLLDIAGICDRSGQILGLMPHPEAAILPTHHPRWTRGERFERPLQLFENAIQHAQDL